MSVRSAVGFDGGIPISIQNLESVLATEPAGDGGNLDITNLNSLTATTINGTSGVGQDLGQTLTNGNEASKDIDMNTFSLTNVTSINGFTTNRNTQGEFITNTTIPATANTDFIIPIQNAISLDIGTYLANVKINLSGTASVPTSYNIDLYLDDGATNDLLTSSIIDSASAINGVSLTIPAFPVAVTTDNSILTLKGRVNANSSVLVSGFGNSYINCGLIFAGAITPPNPPAPTLKWSFATKSGAPTNMKSLASDNTGQYVIGTTTTIIYRSADYGSTWVSLTGGVSFNFTGVASSSNGVKLFASSSTNLGLIRSLDSGATWTTALDNTYPITSVACSSDGVNVVVCSSNDSISISKIYRSTDSGATFTQIYSGQYNNFIDIVSDSTGQYLTLILDSGDRPITSTDFGATFTAGLPSDSRWVSVASNSTGQYLIGCLNNNGKVYLSSDYGATFNLSSAGTNNWSSVSSDSTGAYLFACVGGAGSGSGYVYTSQDFGATWITQTNGSLRNWTLIHTNSTGDRLVCVGNGYIVTGTAS